MCFTVNVNIIREELEKRYGTTLIDHENYRPSYYYNAFSFPDLPVIYRHQSGENNMGLFRWGLVPSWTDSEEDALKIRQMTHNARSETISEKPSFSDSFARRRCLVPVMGFFEWKHEAGTKIPYYIYHPETPVISLAGIYDRWEVPGEETRLYSFSIVTTAANSMMSEIHNTKKRMPVIIDPEDEDEWLSPGTHGDKLKLLMGTYKEDVLKAHTVSPMAGNNRINRNSPEVIKPYIYPSNQTLF